MLGRVVLVHKIDKSGLGFWGPESWVPGVYMISAMTAEQWTQNISLDSE